MVIGFLNLLPWKIEFQNSEEGIYIKCRTRGNVFNLIRLKFRTKVLASIIREHLYVDDGDIVSHSERCLEPHISELDSACDEFG